MLLRSALTQLAQEPPQQKVPMNIVAWMVGQILYFFVSEDP